MSFVWGIIDGKSIKKWLHKAMFYSYIFYSTESIFYQVVDSGGRKETTLILSRDILLLRQLMMALNT